jgi:hypothetical protein
MGLFASKRSELDDNQQPVVPTAQAAAPQPAAQNLSGRDEIAIDKAIMARHEDSLARYPRVHLSRGEYVIMEVRRHPIGLLSIWLVSGLLAVLALAILPLYSNFKDSIAATLAIKASSLPSAPEMILPVFGLAILFVLGGLVATYVYNNNLFYLTNESIIQYIQSSLFSTREQVINLVNVDDASYRQQGIVQQVFNFGTVRVSTEGDERNPYVFFYVDKPQQVVRTVNDAMEDATGYAVRYRQHKEVGPTPSDPTNSGMF